MIGVAMASTVLATPALARDGQWYVELDGGPMLLKDVELVEADGTVSVDTAKGYDFGGIVGYDFGAFRLESETSYREADSTGLSVPGGSVAAAGDVNSLSFMVNGLFDFGADDGVQGYMGAGIGVARTEVDASIQASAPRLISDSGSGLAWQAIAGVRAPMSDNWDMGLRYRMFNAQNVNLVSSFGTALEGKVTGHSLLGTLTYNFGGAAPATQTCWNGSVISAKETCPTEPVQPATQTCWNGSVVPATATCPAKPEEVVCKTGPYIVFFEWDKSDITPEAASILNEAASAYANCGNASVMLAGHADASGQKKYNEGLSQRRNAQVRAYLGSRGVPDTLISSQAFGETSLRVPTTDGVREMQNRRVEVTYGPNSGM